MSSSSIDILKIGPRRSARIAQRAIVCKSSDGSSLNSDGNADSSKLKEMAGANHISNNFKVVACSSRRNMKRRAHFLPEEVMFNILLWLPVEVLYNVMRYVCQEWYNVINDPGFINAHLKKSTDGLLIQTCCSSNSTWISFVEIHNCDIHTSRFRYKIPGPVYGSCDGLIFYRYNDKNIYYVANPITKQVVALPQLYAKWWHLRSLNITYVRSTGRYKVMVFIGGDKNNDDVCLILTLGIDSAWRLIDTKHLPNLRRYLLASDSLSTEAGGYIYLTSNGASHIFALDAEAEIFHQFPVPVYHKATIRGTYMAWKSFLALVAECAGFVWELWGLTELNTGKWTRLFSIDLRGQKCMIEQIFDVQDGKCSLGGLIPVASIKNGEVVIFRRLYKSRACLVYNLKTGEVSSFVAENDDIHLPNKYRCHVRSLVSLKLS